MARTVVSGDGRRLAVEEFGAADGYPIFLMHGAPGSRMGPRPRGSILYRAGIRLLAYDRPGYGGSERMPGRTVADAATDVYTIANALGIDRFAVVGRSGGGPHALACAALLPERVDCTAVLVGLAPRDAAGLSWTAGMTPVNRADYAVAIRGADPLAALLEDRAAAARSDPAAMLSFLNSELPESDRQVVADYGIRGMLEANFTEAFRQSAAGWIDDTLAFISPWRFDPASIRTPVLFWHGEKDVFAPIGHSRWLASQIRHAALVVARGAAHFGALVVLPQVLCWLVSGGARSVEWSVYQ